MLNGLVFVEEGETLTIFLYTGENDIQKNIDVGYEITGIQQTDLLSGSITGTFHVVNHVGQLDFIIRRDNFTEGNETMNLIYLKQSRRYWQIP